ncbi:LOW QUALITY PROTEIN: sulfotransferase 6B1-like [Sceloporus undulatus]|uniref:LOW QUALITY PROTEIN: sulfotransferase 6B1-like n=1 Tax=Sceloporus undulatus TaxID=8520 RepID=UPI001C4B06F9|nr:LOW QUALITY PROTEIN: sulfotransferase 6B1-like [Sceloporus undulatus]
MAQKGLSENLEKKLEENKKTPPEEGLILYNGELYPAGACKPETLSILHTFKARSDDVVLVGYAKTGTNWLGHILIELEAASGKYDEEERNRRKQQEKELKLMPYLEFGDPEKFQRMEMLPSRRIIRTHLIPHKMPKTFFEQNTKMLVLFRNPKDTAVSYFHFAKSMKLTSSEKTWDEFFSDFINGKVAYGFYLDHITEWNKYIDDKNVMFITYEELKENTTSGLKRIAEFFEFSVTEKDIQTIEEKTSFKTMKERAAETHGDIGQNFFRKGIVGDWKSIFSVDQSEEMDRKFEENVGRTRLGKMLKYEVYCKN